jgi:hypothetical protein
MTTTANAAAQPLLAPTDKQVETITDLAAELSIDVVMPRTRKVAGRLIFKLSQQVRDQHGDKLPPTSRQLRFLQELGEERGKTYAIPTTRKQASAKIAQILGSAKPEASAPAEKVAAAA